MASSAEEILSQALKLPEGDRLHIVSRLLETIPGDLPGLSEDEDEDGFVAELERRASDSQSTVPVSELWKRD